MTKIGRKKGSMEIEMHQVEDFLFAKNAKTSYW